MFTNTIPTQDFLNSKYWKEVRKRTGNKIVDVNDNLWIQCTKIPVFNFYGGYIPRADISKINFDELKEVAKREGIFFIKIDPNNLNEARSSKLEARNENSSVENQESKINDQNVDDRQLTTDNQKSNTQYPISNIQVQTSDLKLRTSLPVQYQHSTVINLEQTEEQFLESMKSKHRYNLKVAEKNAVEVEISDSNEALDTFLDLYKKTTLRQGYTGRSASYLKTVFETLKEFNQDLVYIATARFEGKAISSWMLFVYEDTIIYPYGGSSDENRNVMATYKLVMEIFKWGKSKNKKYFDMFGIDAKNPEDGYSRFKLGFAGEEVKFADTFDIVYNRFVYFFYKIWEKFNR